MAAVRGYAVSHRFPAFGETELWNINDAWFVFTATTCTLHVPYNPDYGNYYIEWCDEYAFTHTIHISNSVGPDSGTVAGDILTKEIIGFEPGSVWFFRPVADTSSSEGEQ